MQIPEIMSRIIEQCIKYNVQEVVLFGSRAKGTANTNSDFDIAVTGVKDIEGLREVLRTSFQADLISGDDWMDMLKIRNELFYDYDGEIVE